MGLMASGLVTVPAASPGPKAPASPEARKKAWPCTAYCSSTAAVMVSPNPNQEQLICWSTGWWVAMAESTSSAMAASFGPSTQTIEALGAMLTSISMSRLTSPTPPGSLGLPVAPSTSTTAGTFAGRFAPCS